MKSYDLGNIKNIENYIFLLKKVVDKNVNEVILVSSNLFALLNVKEINGVTIIDGGFEKFDYVEVI